MEKRKITFIKLKLVFAIVFITFSCAALFAQQDKEQAQKFTVTFDADGGKPEKKDWQSDKPFELPPAPSKEGYDFAGWFSEKEDGDQFTEQTPVDKNIPSTQGGLQKNSK